MKAQRITLNDIAELAGVTKMTVSRYLRTPDKVKPETAERIASVIAEIGYEPDPDNPAMSSTVVPRIGVLIPSFHNQIFADLLAGIESVTAAHGYQTLVVNYDYDRQREEEQIAAVLAFNVKGLLLTESVHTLRAEKYLNAAKIPVAEVMGLSENPGRINVGFDNFKAGLDMTNMLLASGKRHIVYFGSMSDVRDEQRYAGYCEAMEAAGLRVGRIAPNKVSSVSIGTGMMTLARQMYADMDGILCTNDDLAVGVLQECLASGIRVPQTLAIAGFHGLEIGQVVSPRLASVLTPRAEMGKVATEILIKKIKGLPTIEKVDLHYRLSMGETI
ncbi:MULTISPECIES: LacI family DNA-binding transcriptional regulator [Enterobacter]|uniref:LacI family DNA-binding transcriptional regulator n=1 Tax=Enterobacter TaxID=547 RepID=UPI0015E992C7|nr:MULTISPECIES: LacI family DNA-binding transcriptional regulator [Enterobacter]HDR2752822.1 LacI family DNA-binding transcriptional regulator [Enterobacter asburiae]QMR76631.1 LacI family DNA-binding transcriptional regulator [Enterobacter sp. RHBSTW-00175]WNT37166.1 LacI family DNA-binding transcriptional regulator [Enterobacter cloacae]HDR2786179.1 LacI family DNA-binding transcriptional regulator [Enterobacter asburiae]HDR2792131.1 LacI family DNA-binding transcriptional regulator [Entero